MRFLFAAWPWVLLVLSLGILSSPVYSIVSDMWFPWNDGQNEVFKVAGSDYRIGVGGSHEELTDEGERYSSDVTYWGYSSNIPEQLVHLSEHNRSYQQRSYILLYSFLHHPGVWTVTKNQDGEYFVSFSSWAIYKIMGVNILFLFLFLVAVRVIRKR
jgi:hypothetical protein